VLWVVPSWHSSGPSWGFGVHWWGWRRTLKQQRSPKGLVGLRHTTLMLLFRDFKRYAFGYIIEPIQQMWTLLFLCMVLMQLQTLWTFLCFDYFRNRNVFDFFGDLRNQRNRDNLCRCFSNCSRDKTELIVVRQITEVLVNSVNEACCWWTRKF